MENSEDECYVCGDPTPHADRAHLGQHNFWSVADARREFEKEDRRMRLPEMPEARYVRTFRPY